MNPLSGGIPSITGGASGAVGGTAYGAQFGDVNIGHTSFSQKVFLSLVVLGAVWVWKKSK